jgi:general secretion pathway protein A
MRDFLSLFGLKHNPFSRNIPHEALWKAPGSEAFFFRVETIVMDGGFALITGEAGLGKSKALQLLAERLLRIGGDVVVGVMERPQNSLGDFYRELGDLFSVDLSPSNRYRGFRGLREKWRAHIQSTMSHSCLTELRLLGSARFDSECLVTTVLCGDARLPERFRSEELAPLGSRIRTRWNLEPWDRNALRGFLEHTLDAAGALHLMTDELKTTLVEHAGGNIRVLCGMGEELLAIGAQRQVKRLDEQLYFEIFERKPTAEIRRKRQSSQS